MDTVKLIANNKFFEILDIFELGNGIQQSMFQIDDTFIDFYDFLFEEEIDKQQDESKIEDDHDSYENDSGNIRIVFLAPVNGVDQYHVQQT